MRDGKNRWLLLSFCSLVFMGCSLTTPEGVEDLEKQLNSFQEEVKEITIDDFRQEVNIEGMYAQILPGGRRSVLKIEKNLDTDQYLASQSMEANTSTLLFERIPFEFIRFGKSIYLTYTNEDEQKSRVRLVFLEDGDVVEEFFNAGDPTGLYKETDSSSVWKSEKKSKNYFENLENEKEDS